MAIFSCYINILFFIVKQGGGIVLFNYEEEFKKLNEKIKALPFVVKYWYEDNFGSTFSNDSCYIPIAYGDDPSELANIAEEKGYHKATKPLDPKGYSVGFNDGFPIKNITHEMRETLDKFHGWRGNQAELS